MDIINTGERILPEKETPLMIARHFCAYRLAKEHVGAKALLDIGCGEGYGVYYLANFAKEAIGIDYDNSIINYAKDKYKKENLAFYKIDINDLDSLKAKFDIICAFQFIEHVRDTKKFLDDIRNLLNPQGAFICSTPNRLDASPHSDKPSHKFHVKEYLFHEFKELLAGYFTKIDMLGLKRGRRLNFYRRLKKIGLFNFLPQNINPVKRFYAHIDCADFVFVKKNIEKGLDFIAISKK